MAEGSSAKRKAIVFDLDGTLIDSAPDITAAVNRVMADLKQPHLSVDYVERFIGDGSRSMLSRIFKDHGMHLADVELGKRLSDYMEYYAQAPAACTRFFDHVHEDIRALHSKGIKLGVCTNKPHRLTGLVLEHLGISSFFTSALGADAESVTKRKPDPAHLLAVIEGMNETADNTVYVGDTEVDRATAQNAGVPFYLVKWGGGRFLDSNGDTKIDRLADLLPFTSRDDSRVDVA
ncbi:HAD-IA family hydrolase [Hoeflea prorocentri]|uniref:phosphoglycolate phosphatase n=1 Tax=Hoeflea prorocentri TaxID=1922333 RepID=A0A9X3ZFK1_9HYPH|nr:HAD-IA family hydrolase [Hoeflea prorocentri]MCY6379782.1 HAD-IA family hydrolase [Hoeflea prorocentri]MDA5397582.1 HAD-IA family hydrolase [Hoeflea prorocentri]